MARTVAPVVLVAVLAAAYFIAVDRRQVLDERIWTGNGIKFQQALSRGDWTGTRLATRPGVSVSWIAGLTARTVFGNQRLNMEPPDLLNQDHSYIVTSRVAMSAVVISLSVAMYALLQNFFSSGQAITACLLIGLHPLLLLPPALVWTDILLTFFFPLSIISWLVFLRTDNGRHQLAAGFFWGLALL